MSLLTPLVSTLPNNILNGTPNDASQVMADFNAIVGNINARLNQSSATGGDQYIGLTTNSKYNGTSVFDALTQLADRQSVYTDTGSVNAMVVTPNPAMTALTAGQVFWFSPANTTTSVSATININGIGAVGLANWDGTLLPAGQLIAGSYYLAVTAGPATAVRVLNPSRATSSFTITLSGMTSATTGTVNFSVLPDGKTIYAWINSGITGTSNSTSMTGTGIPTVIQAGADSNVPFGVEDSGGGQWGMFTGLNGGTWTFAKTYGAPSTSFTNTGIKGLLNFRTTWNKD